MDSTFPDFLVSIDASNMDLTEDVASENESSDNDFDHENANTELVSMKTDVGPEETNPENVHECAICDFSAATPEAVTHHFNTEHNTRVKIKKPLKKPVYVQNKKDDKPSLFSCFLCDFSTEKLTRLSSHMREIHSDDLKLNASSDDDASPAKPKSIVASTTKRKRKSTLKVAEAALSPPKRVRKKSATEVPKSDSIIKSESHGCLKPQKCLLCEFESIQGDKLVAHMFDEHIEVAGTKKCPHCDLVTEEIERLKFHVAVAHNDNDCYLCGFCGMSINIAELLEAHIHYAHWKDAPFICAHCGDSTPTLKHFKNHITECHMEYPPKTGRVIYQCAYCSWDAENHNEYKEHIETMHPEGKLYKCKFCDYCSATVGTFSKHMLTIHYRQRIHKCKLCLYSAARRDCLTTHYTIRHKLEKHQHPTDDSSI